MSEREKQFRDRYNADALDVLVESIRKAVSDYDEAVGHVSHLPTPTTCMRCEVVRALPDWVRASLRRIP